MQEKHPQYLKFQYIIKEFKVQPSESQNVWSQNDFLPIPKNYWESPEFVCLFFNEVVSIPSDHISN